MNNNTSSLDSFDSSDMTGLRARRGAVTFDNPIVLSGGGPPLGGPLTITVSPDSTCKQLRTNAWFPALRLRSSVTVSPFQKYVINYVYL